MPSRSWTPFPHREARFRHGRRGPAAGAAGDPCHRERKGDPLFGIRRTLKIGAEHLIDKQAARLDAMLTAVDPGHEVTLAVPRLPQLPQ
jgi:hypothetical protein